MASQGDEGTVFFSTSAYAANVACTVGRRDAIVAAVAASARQLLNAGGSSSEVSGIEVGQSFLFHIDITLFLTTQMLMIDTMRSMPMPTMSEGRSDGWVTCGKNPAKMPR